MILNKNNMPSYATGTKYSDSTLKSMTKDKLLEYLDIAQHNYECANECLFNIRQYAEKLDKALDKACDSISDYSESCPFDMYDKDMNCQESCTNNTEKCWREYLMKGTE